MAINLSLTSCREQRSLFPTICVPVRITIRATAYRVFYVGGKSDSRPSRRFLTLGLSTNNWGLYNKMLKT